MCTVYSNADFSTQKSGCSSVFIMKHFLTQYSVKHCFPSPSDWSNKELNSLRLGRRGESRMGGGGREKGLSWDPESCHWDANGEGSSRAGGRDGRYQAGREDAGW